MDVSKLCRCCLGEFSQDDSVCSDEMVMDMYTFCIQLKCQLQGEDVPRSFCTKCRDQIKLSYIFIRHAKLCNKKLQKTILENRAIKNAVINNYDDESCKEHLQINLDLCYNNSESFCPQDDESVKTDYEYQQNIQVNNNTTEGKVFICDICDKNFHQRRHLIEHLPVHSKLKPFKCDLCSKAFKSKKLLGCHTKVHKIRQSGEKPYMCDVCNKHFSSRCSLNVHATTHSEHRPRPFSCSHCEKLFITKQQLWRHEGTHNESYPSLCTVCGKRFKTQRNLSEHMVRHSGVKSYACRVCSYRTAHSSSLRRHEATHSDQKMYQCQHCQKRFTCRNGLVRHIRIHTGERPVQCPSCPLRFIDHSKRKVHLMRVHKVPFNEIPRLSADGTPIPD